MEDRVKGREQAGPVRVLAQRLGYDRPPADALRAGVGSEGIALLGWTGGALRVGRTRRVDTRLDGDAATRCGATCVLWDSAQLPWAESGVAGVGIPSVAGDAIAQDGSQLRCATEGRCGSV